MVALADGTALYHIRGEGGLLLYIGVSDDFGRRWREHAKRQPWWGEMRSMSVDRWYPSRAEAEEAEAAAIKAEGPRYNKAHNAAARSRQIYIGASLGPLFASSGESFGRSWVPGFVGFPEAHELVAQGLIRPSRRVGPAPSGDDGIPGVPAA